MSDELTRFAIDGLLIAASIVPALLVMWFFYARDVFREPTRVLFVTFGFGIASVGLISLFNHPFVWLENALPYELARVATRAFVRVAAVEESCKLVVLLAYSFRHREFDEPMDGIVYGVAASLGFAAIENVTYVLDGGALTAVLRAVTAVPAHAFDGAIMGYYVGLARFSRTHRNKLILTGWMAAVLLHGFYDFPLMATATLIEDFPTSMLPWVLAPGLAIATMVFGLVWTLALVRRTRAAQLELDATHQRPALVARSGVTPRLPSRWAWVALIAGGLLATAGIAICISTALTYYRIIDRLSFSMILAAVIGAFPFILGGILLFGQGVAGLNARV